GRRGAHPAGRAGADRLPGLRDYRRRHRHARGRDPDPHRRPAPEGVSTRFDAAVAAIDEANAADPVRIAVDGGERGKELVHADLVEQWVRTLDPDASDLQVLAARAHHLRRWVVPRSDYPEGRAGYLRWRTDHKKRQAAEVAEILRTAGYDDAEIEQVA